MKKIAETLKVLHYTILKFYFKIEIQSAKKKVVQQTLSCLDPYISKKLKAFYLE